MSVKVSKINSIVDVIYINLLKQIHGFREMIYRILHILAHKRIYPMSNKIRFLSLVKVILFHYREGYWTQ